MQKLNFSLLFLFILVGSVVKAEKTNTSKLYQDRCTMLLQEFIRQENSTEALIKGDERSEKETFEAIRRALLEQGFSEVEITQLGVLDKIAPLFNNGAVYKAVSEELRVRGFKTKAKIRDVLDNFREFDDDLEKIDFVSAVFDRLDSDLSFDLTFNKTNQLKEVAHQNKMSLNEYLYFIRLWRSLDHAAVKMVILNTLWKHNKNFIKNVAAQRRRWWQPVAFSNLVRTPILISQSTFELAIQESAGGDAFSAQVNRFIIEASTRRRVRFVQLSSHFLTSGQIERVLHDESLATNLDVKTITFLKRRLSNFQRISELFFKNNLDPVLSQLTQEPNSKTQNRHSKALAFVALFDAKIASDSHSAGFGGDYVTSMTLFKDLFNRGSPSFDIGITQDMFLGMVKKLMTLYLVRGGSINWNEIAANDIVRLIVLNPTRFSFLNYKCLLEVDKIISDFLPLQSLKNNMGLNNVHSLSWKSLLAEKRQRSDNVSLENKSTEQVVSEIKELLMKADLEALEFLSAKTTKIKSLDETDVSEETVATEAESFLQEKLDAMTIPTQTAVDELKERLKQRN